MDLAHVGMPMELSAPAAVGPRMRMARPLDSLVRFLRKDRVSEMEAAPIVRLLASPRIRHRWGTVRSRARLPSTSRRSGGIDNRRTAVFMAFRAA